MKNNRNVFKYIFILVVIALIGGAIYILYYNTNKPKDEEDEEVVENEVKSEISIVDNLKMGISNYDTMNPLLTNNKEIINIDKLIFEPLINITSDYHTETCLAKSFEKKSDTQYEVKLDTSIKWQDGGTLFSKDVEFTVNQLKQGGSIYSNNVSKIASVETPDSETVIFNLTEPVQFFDYDLDFPILSSSYYSGENFNTSSKIPIGTGMYKIASIDDSSILLIRNDRWRNLKDKTPKTQSITIHRYSAAGENFNSFKLGNTDIITTNMTNYSDYVGTMGYNKKEFPGRYFDFVSLNCNDTILSDKFVRKALNYAINKDTVISGALGNSKIKSYSVFDYGSFLNDTSYNINSSRDEAKKILEEGGWIYSNDRWQKNIGGTVRRLTLNMMVNEDNAERINVANNIKSQLGDIGININVQTVSRDKYYENLNNKTYQITLTGVLQSTKPDISYFYGDGNIANYSNEEVKANINNGEKFGDILKIVSDDVPYIPLYRNKITLLLNANVGGNFTPTAYFSYYNFNEWFRQQ